MPSCLPKQRTPADHRLKLGPNQTSFFSIVFLGMCHSAKQISMTLTSSVLLNPLPLSYRSYSSSNGANILPAGSHHYFLLECRRWDFLLLKLKLLAWCLSSTSSASTDQASRARSVLHLSVPPSGPQHQNPQGNGCPKDLFSQNLCPRLRRSGVFYPSTKLYLP